MIYGRTDPTYFLMSAEMYWRGAMDPGVGDYFHHEWVAQSWLCLFFWAEECYEQ